MNYLAEIIAFERWLETNYLPTSSQLLWYKMMNLCNRSGWSEWIIVDNLTLMAAMQKRREASMIEARDGLLKAGLMQYQKGKKGSPNKYKMISFVDKCTFKNEVKSEEQAEVKSEVQSEVQSVDLYKYKQNKNIKNIYADTEETTCLKPKEIQDFFESIWTLYPVKKGKASVSKTQKQKLYEVGYEHIKKAIERYCEENRDKDKQFWKHGSTFFNSGYVDYLDENYAPLPANKKTNDKNRFHNFEQSQTDYDAIVWELMKGDNDGK